MTIEERLNSIEVQLSKLKGVLIGISMICGALFGLLSYLTLKMIELHIVK